MLLMDRMSRQINIDRIRDLEKQIEEGAGDMVEFKRARNSLLDIPMVVSHEIPGPSSIGTSLRKQVSPL